MSAVSSGTDYRQCSSLVCALFAQSLMYNAVIYLVAYQYLIECMYTLLSNVHVGILGTHTRFQAWNLTSFDTVSFV